MSGDRIVVDPEELRRVAARMRGAALLLSSTGRQLASRPLPAMPPAVTSLVAESIGHANAELQDLAADLLREVGTLYARAMWAESGDAGRGWLLPGGHGLAPAEYGLVDDLPAAAGAEVRAEAWSVEVLDRMQESMASVSDDFAADLHDVGGSEGTPGSAFGDLTLAAEHAPDVEAVPLDPEELRTGSQVAGGALAAALNEAHSDPSGIGILGCIVVGGGLMDAPDPGVDAG